MTGIMMLSGMVRQRCENSLRAEKALRWNVWAGGRADGDSD